MEGHLVGGVVASLTLLTLALGFKYRWRSANAFRWLLAAGTGMAGFALGTGGKSMDTSRVIFAAEEAWRIGYIFGGEAPFWTPTDDQVQELESLLPRYLKSTPPIDDKPVENVLEYGRQYFGVTQKGRRLIYLNAFCNPSKVDPRWEKEIVLVKDGGSCYFQVFFDPVKKEFFDLHYNGQA